MDGLAPAAFALSEYPAPDDVPYGHDIKADNKPHPDPTAPLRYGYCRSARKGVARRPRSPKREGVFPCHQ